MSFRDPTPLTGVLLNVTYGAWWLCGECVSYLWAEEAGSTERPDDAGSIRIIGSDFFEVGHHRDW